MCPEQKVVGLYTQNVVEINPQKGGIEEKNVYAGKLILMSSLFHARDRERQTNAG